MKATHCIGAGLLFAAAVMLINEAYACTSVPKGMEQLAAQVSGRGGSTVRTPEPIADDRCGYLAAWAYAAALARADGFSERTTLGFLKDVEEATRDVVRDVYAGERMEPDQVRESYYRNCLEG